MYTIRVGLYIITLFSNCFICFLSEQIAFIEKDKDLVSLSKIWGFETSDIKQLGQK